MAARSGMEGGTCLVDIVDVGCLDRSGRELSESGQQDRRIIQRSPCSKWRYSTFLRGDLLPLARTPEDFFKSLYGDADEASRRAMMKSYQESNGTVLSTNWGEVGDKFQAPQPPAGMEVKKD